MYAVPASSRDAEIDETQANRGAPLIFPPTLVQCAPPSRVSCTLPSSVPTQMTLGSRGLSAIERIVQCVSARVLSELIGPPLGFWVSLSFVVRSGLMAVQVEPASVVLNSTLPP